VTREKAQDYASRSIGIRVPAQESTGTRQARAFTLEGKELNDEELKAGAVM
jgi:hypothetical protein